MSLLRLELRVQGQVEHAEDAVHEQSGTYRLSLRETCGKRT
jgi:hypothetical protein